MKIKNCTARNPMPVDCDQTGQHWYHHGARAKAGEPPMLKTGDSQIWVCPNCQHEFRVIRNAPISSKQAVRQVQEMKKNGWKNA